MRQIMTERASADKGYPWTVRSLVVLLAGCGFQISAGSDAGPRDTGATADAIDAPADAPADAPNDGPRFSCPAEYNVIVTATTSRYRISSVNAVFSPHHESCNDDGVGATHLAVFDTSAEKDQIVPFLAQAPQPTNGRFYVGAVQMPSELTVGAGWLWFTGETFPAAMWTTAQPDDDADFDETDHEQQLAVIDSTGAMFDVGGSIGYGALCECDGKTIDPNVAPFIP
jgi:hypothetical protein